MYNWDSPWEECAFVTTVRMQPLINVSVFLWFVFGCAVHFRISQTAADLCFFGDLVLFDERDTANNPSILSEASNEIISDYV